MSAVAVIQENGPVLPHNIATEATLLGALMQRAEMIDRVADTVLPEHFFEPLHGRIYGAILREYGQGRDPTPITLKSYFEHDPAMQEVGGPGYLARLSGNGAALVGAMSCAQQIVELAKRRLLIGAFAEASEKARDYETPVADVVGTADQAMSDALQERSTVDSSTFADAFDTTLQAIEDEAAGLTPQGIKIAGLQDFNALTGDLRRGELMYLGGRPSMGKTALAIRLALGAAEGGAGTLFISLEMRTSELVTRAIADMVFEHGQSPGYDAIRRGKIDAFTRNSIAEARQRGAKLPLILTDPPSLNIARLAMLIRRHKRRMQAQGQSLDLVLIDYLGLIKAADPRAKRYEQVGDISRTLKSVAKECDVAIICLAQLNRECEKREDKRPMLSDLRDAGDIEQDADQVFFVYRDEYYLERSEPDPTDKKRAEWETSMGFARDRLEIIAAKVRNGRVGKKLIHFFAKHQAVRDGDFLRGER